MTPAALPAAKPLYDTGAVGVVEAQAASALGGDAFELMRRAGLSAWRFLLQHWPSAQRIVVACGPGNNGGDGYVLARHARESGREVRVLRLGGHEPRSPLARHACADFERSGGRVATFAGEMPAGDLVVDALFGIGFQRAPDAELEAFIAAINRCGPDVLALDVPSGVDASRASVTGGAVRAARTLQFIAEHAGLRTGGVLECTGCLALAGLDVPRTAFAGVVPAAQLLEADMLPAMLPPRRRNAHKGESGHVLVVGGDEGMGGASMLAAEAALRTGAGLVSVATRPQHVTALLTRRPELMARGVDHATALAPLLSVADACAVGPGLGRGDWGEALLSAALATGRSLVLDADALNSIAAKPRALPADAIITPHPGEAARLLGVLASDVQSDRYTAARLLCENLGCVVVLKGAGTLVAAPGQTVRVIAAGNPGMAVGGMGDALTGTIASLRAQGFEPFDAAATGALLHAAAGDAAAAAGGERGLLPSDLVDALRRCVNP